MTRLAWIGLTVLAAAALAADNAPTTLPAGAGAPPATAGAGTDRPASKLVKLKHLRVDLASRTITLDAEVCLRSGTLELLVCKEGTKEYESVLCTKAMPSDLHTALLLLDLTPGKPAQWSGEDESATFLPPRGAELRITLRWKDKDGKAQEADAAAWLAAPEKRPLDDAPPVAIPPRGSELGLLCRWKDKEGKLQETDAGAWLAAAGKPNPPVEPPKSVPAQGTELKLVYRWKDADGKVQETEIGPWRVNPEKGRLVSLPKAWVFVGSEILPGNRYWADGEGDMISVSNFASSVIDVPFESSNKNALLDFVANTKVIPEKGTAVEVVITPLPDAAKADHARATLEIDRLGRLRVEGRDIAFDKISEWARAYMDRHARGMVVIRADGLALVDDLAKVKDELRLGGVREFQEQHAPATGYVMPRTPRQAERALREWQDKFDNPKDYITEPSTDAEAVLKQIREEMSEMDRLKALGGEYELRLRQALGKYKASTRPTDGGQNP